MIVQKATGSGALAAFCRGAAAAGLGAVGQRLLLQVGLELPLLPVVVLGVLVGSTSSPFGRRTIERLAGGRAAVPVLVLGCSLLTVLLAALELSVLVPAVATSASMHAVVVAPSRRRLVQSAVITAGTTAAALLAQGLGLVGGLLPLPATALLALAFLAVTWPAVTNAFEASARAHAERTARDAERAQHIAVLHHAAHHDSLTGVLSRRGLEALVADAPTADADVLHAVLFVDLDGFKPVNDEHGHAAGDALLVEAALRMVRCVRPADRIARTGGDEFVIVMTGLVHTGVVDRVVEQLRSVVCEPVVLPSGAQVRVGVSIGTAVASAEKPLHALLRSADEAMYAEKRSRRQLRPLSS